MDKAYTDSVAHLELKLETDNEYFNCHKSSILHGVIMQEIRPEYAELLHQQGLKPYSQYIQLEGKNAIWHIKTFTREAEQGILEPMMREAFREFYIEHDDQRVFVRDKLLKKERISDFLDEFYDIVSDRYLTIEFVTPTAFKKNGKYSFFPEIYNIYYSCMKKFDIASMDHEMFNEETLEQLTEASEITAYSLHSVRFFVEGVKIPAFMGRVTISIHGNQTMQNFARLLLRFGEYSGIGIKTAMGMGAMRLMKKAKEDQTGDRERV